MKRLEDRISELELENAELKLINENLRAENEELKRKNFELEEKIKELIQEIASFKNHFFGKKSEKLEPNNSQEPYTELPLVREEKSIIKEHTRSSKKQHFDGNYGLSGLRFGENVTIEEIHVPNPAVLGLKEDEFEVIGTIITDRLCMKKSALYVKRYIRDKVKIKETQEIKEPEALEDPLD